MKDCSRTQRRLLLADSGELSPTDRRGMDAHLASCETCRAYAFLVNGAERAAARLPDSGPGDHVLRAIRVASHERVQGRARQGTLWMLRPALRPLAVAATLALAVSAWFLVGRDGHAERIHTVASAITVVAAMDENGEGPAEAGTSDLRTLARELLAMEGLAVDDLGEDDLFSRLEELPSTDPQSRSTREPVEKRCV